MGVRAWLDEHSALGTVAAVVLLAAAVVYLLFSSGLLGGSSGVVPTGKYFYNLKTNELFVAGLDAIPPIQTKSGDAAVRAYVFSCTDCSDAQSHVVGWLLKYSAADKKRMEQTQHSASRFMGNELLRAKDGGPWLSMATPQASAIRKAAVTGHCHNGQLAHRCYP